MKPRCSIGLVAALLLSALSAHADEASYAAVVKERDSVLAQIVAECEAMRSSGTADEEAIAKAQLVLYRFRRDVSRTTAEKIKNQEMVVSVFGKKMEYVTAKMSAGLCGTIEALEAKAVFLEEKQILEELRIKAGNG